MKNGGIGVKNLDLMNKPQLATKGFDILRDFSCFPKNGVPYVLLLGDR